MSEGVLSGGRSEWIYAIPGVLALFGAAISHGRNAQRLDSLEEDVKKVVQLKETVGRLDERTKRTESDVKEIKSNVNLLVQKMLDDGRAHRNQSRSQ